MTSFVRLRATLADGRVIEGPVQGSGGRLGSGTLHAGYDAAASHALIRVRGAARRHAAGKATGLHEPRPGHVAMYPDECAASAGEPVIVPLAGTRWEVAPEAGPAVAMEQQIQTEIENAYKRVAFPEARSLDELFSEVRPRDRHASMRQPYPESPIVHTFPTEETRYPKNRNKPPVRYQGKCELSSYTAVSSAGARASAEVTPRPIVIAYLGRHMLLSDGERLYFKIVVRGTADEQHLPRTVLVTCDYNRIIGGSYLAIIPYTALPEWMRKELES